MMLPAFVGIATAGGPAWVFMWALAISIYAGCKWLTFATSPVARQAPFWQSAGYLLLWTGMDADSFFAKSALRQPRWSQWAWAAWQAAFGVWLVTSMAPHFMHRAPQIAGWLAMIGIVSILHFGLSQLLSLIWRSLGISAQHIMHKPLLARSLADFWGRRWNLAFRDLMHKFVFQPVVPRVGGAGAIMAVFFVSGVIHDAVISLAARGGFGLPTLYFLIQGLAQLWERTPLAKSLGLGRGLRGWLFAVIVVVAPAGLLFHPPFITRVVLPMVADLQSMLP